MRSLVLGLILLLGVSTVSWAKIVAPPFTPAEFDVDISQYPFMVQIENAKSEQVDTYYDFTNAAKEFEIRYTFFKQTELDFKDLRAATQVYLFAVIQNVAGAEASIKSISNFNDSDVQNEFNGDFGETVFIQDCKSDYTNDYKYIMLNFYIKENQGIVCQAILFNSQDIFTTDYFMSLFHSFRFHE